jgi:DNA recombination protein RmuC
MVVLYNARMETAIILGIFVVVNMVVLVLVIKRVSKTPDNSESMKLMLTQINELNRTVDEKMGEGTKTMSAFMNSQMDNTQRLMNNITKQVHDQLLEVVKGVTETRESTKQVFTIAEQLRNLEKVLKNQKQRGNLGEASLELILSNVLPGQYESQYMFKDGEKVDFIIKTREGLLPVDSKFPLENYIRLLDESDDQMKEVHQKNFKSDVKKRIDETAKYIRPEEGTMPFAFMFIPAEGIYYDLLNSDVGIGINSRDLIDYAYQQKNVVIASPTTFLAYLQTILFGNKRAQIQDAAKDIMKNVTELGKHLNAYEDAHNSIGKSLSAAINHYEKSSKSFKQIDKDILRITGSSADLEPLVLDKPSLE